MKLIALSASVAVLLTASQAFAQTAQGALASAGNIASSTGSITTTGQNPSASFSNPHASSTYAVVGAGTQGVTVVAGGGDQAPGVSSSTGAGTPAAVSSRPDRNVLLGVSAAPENNSLNNGALARGGANVTNNDQTTKVFRQVDVNLPK